MKRQTTISQQKENHKKHNVDTKIQSPLQGERILYHRRITKKITISRQTCLNKIRLANGNIPHTQRFKKANATDANDGFSAQKSKRKP